MLSFLRVLRFSFVLPFPLLQPWLVQRHSRTRLVDSPLKEGIMCTVYIIGIAVSVAAAAALESREEERGGSIVTAKSRLERRKGGHYYFWQSRSLRHIDMSTLSNDH